jgi:NTE family protein
VKSGGTPKDGGFLDPAGLEALVERTIPFERIQDHLQAGRLDGLTVTATHVATGRTVVFVQERGATNVAKWSDPTTVAVPCRIGARHALASAAIPLLFRAVEIDGAWYSDGGLRQNVPLSPARRLGADRVLVVNPRHQPFEAGGGDMPSAAESFPGLLFLFGKTLNALLLDRVESDLQRLSSINKILAAGTRAFGPGFAEALNRELGHPPGQGLRPMRATLVRASRDIGHLATDFVKRPAFGRVGGLLGRALRALADDDGSDSDLLSYVLFDGEFAGQLIELGRADARARHDELCAFFA